MLLEWNREKYQRVDGVVSLFLLVTIGGFMSAWFFGYLQSHLLFVAIVPVGLAHMYKRRLEKLLKAFGGAQVSVEDKKLILLKPYQDYEAIIRFRDITGVKASRWLTLDKMKLSLKGGKEIELINFCNQNAILGRIQSG
ncbi:MAG: hypothetical protein OQK78_06435 [Gammaproteobacteria bacterium]|nr:hypothetical protein [Gammaproteobacteria bacterium]